MQTSNLSKSCPSYLYSLPKIHSPINHFDYFQIRVKLIAKGDKYDFKFARNRDILVVHGQFTSISCWKTARDSILPINSQTFFQESLNKKQQVINYHESFPVQKRPRVSELAKRFDLEINEINVALNERAYEKLVSYYKNYKGRSEPRVSDVAKSLGITTKHVRSLLKKYKRNEKEINERKLIEDNKDKVVKYHENSPKPSYRAIAAEFGLTLYQVRLIMKSHKMEKVTSRGKTEEKKPVGMEKVTPKVWHHDKTSTKQREERTLIDLTNEQF